MNSPLPQGKSAHLLETGPHSPCLPEAQGTNSKGLHLFIVLYSLHMSPLAREL